MTEPKRYRRTDRQQKVHDTSYAAIIGLCRTVVVITDYHDREWNRSKTNNGQKYQNKRVVCTWRSGIESLPRNSTFLSASSSNTVISSTEWMSFTLLTSAQHVSLSFIHSFIHSFIILAFWVYRPLLPYGYIAIKHPSCARRVKPSFVIFDIRALWCSALSVRVPGCQKLQMTV